jgi:hypothetical protein
MIMNTVIVSDAMSYDARIRDALRNGWTLQSEVPGRAVMVTAGRGGMDAGGHIICGVLTLLTCGMFALAWLPMIVYMEITATPGQTLIITDHGTDVSMEVIGS